MVHLMPTGKDQMDNTGTTWTGRTKTMVHLMPTGKDQMDNTGTTWTGRTKTMVHLMPTGTDQMDNTGTTWTGRTNHYGPPDDTTGTTWTGKPKTRSDGQQRDNTEKQDNNYGPQDANRRGPVVTHNQEDKKQEGPQDTNRKISGGQNTQEEEIQEVFPYTSRQQKPAGNSQNKNKNKNKNPNNEGGSRLEDFPGMTLTQRAHEMFLEAAIKAPSGEARQLVDRLARALQAMGQNALDVALSRHKMRAETARNQSDTIRKGYENFRFTSDILINMKEYPNEELIGTLHQILEETKYIDDQFKLEQAGLDEFLNRINDQRAERDKRKMTIPNYEGWSFKKSKGKDSARSQERKPAETKTSYAEAAKADTAQVKKETGAISKRGRIPNGNTETSERTQKEMKEDEKGEDSNEGWQTTRDKDKYKRRRAQRRKGRRTEKKKNRARSLRRPKTSGRMELTRRKDKKSRK